MTTLAEAQAEYEQYTAGGATPATTADPYERAIDKWVVPEEGFRARPYTDVGGVPTVGYGRTYNVEPDKIVSKEAERKEAIAFAKRELAPTLGGLLGANEISPDLFDGLVSYGYNAGAGAYTDPEMKAALRSGDETAIRYAIANGRATVNGQPSSALLARRLRESGLQQQQAQQPQRVPEIEEFYPAGMTFEEALAEAEQYAAQTSTATPASMTFEQAMAEYNAYEGPPAAARKETPTDRGWFNNAGRIIGDRFSDITSNIAGLVSQLEQEAVDAFGGLGGIYIDGTGINFASPEEWAAKKEAGEITDLETLSKQEGAKPFESIREGDWEELKRLYKEEGIFNADLWKEVVQFGSETGVQSIADMLAITANLPLYVAQWAVDIGNDRAINEGREESTLNDTVKALPFAAAAAAMEKFGLKGITNAGKDVAENVGKDIIEEGIKAGAKRVVKAGSKAAGREAGTEFVQEQIEYAGEVTGTPVPLDVSQSLERGLQGAIGGGFAGGAGGAMFSTARELLRDTHVPEDVADPTAEPAEGAPETPPPLIDPSNVGDGLDIHDEEDIGTVAYMKVLSSLNNQPEQAAEIAERLAEQIGTDRANEAIKAASDAELAKILQAEQTQQAQAPAAPQAAPAPAAEPAAEAAPEPETAPKKPVVVPTEPPPESMAAFVDETVSPLLKDTNDAIQTVLNEQAQAEVSGADNTATDLKWRAQAVLDAMAQRVNSLTDAGYDTEAMLNLLRHPVNPNARPLGLTSDTARKYFTKGADWLTKKNKGGITKGQAKKFLEDASAIMADLTQAGPVGAPIDIATGVRVERPPTEKAKPKARGKKAQKIKAEAKKKEAEEAELRSQQADILRAAKEEQEAKERKEQLAAEKAAAAEGAAEEAMRVAEQQKKASKAKVVTKGEKSVKAQLQAKRAAQKKARAAERAAMAAKKQAKAAERKAKAAELVAKRKAAREAKAESLQPAPAPKKKLALKQRATKRKVAQKPSQKAPSVPRSYTAEPEQGVPKPRTAAEIAREAQIAEELEAELSKLEHQMSEGPALTEDYDEAEGYERDESFRPSKPLPTTAKGTKYIDPTGREVTTTGRTRERAGTLMVQVFRPWTMEERMKVVEEHGRTLESVDKGRHQWLPEYSLTPVGEVTPAKEVGLFTDPMAEIEHQEDIAIGRMHLAAALRKFTYRKIQDEGIDTAYERLNVPLRAVYNHAVKALHKNDPLLHILKRINRKDLDMEAMEVAIGTIPVLNEGKVTGGAPTKATAWYGIEPYYHPERDEVIDVRTIGLSLDLLNHEELVAPVFVHELIHAATMEALRVDNALAMRMERLRQETIKAVKERGGDPKDHYGLTNVDEFLAEAMTDVDFQELLADIEISDGSSAWSKLVAIISKYLGIAVSDKSILAHVMAGTPRLYQTGSEIEWAIKNKVHLGEYITRYVQGVEDVDDSPATDAELQELFDHISASEAGNYKKDRSVYTVAEKIKQNRVRLKDEVEVLGAKRIDETIGKAVRGALDLGNGPTERVRGVVNNQLSRLPDSHHKTRVAALGFKTRDWIETDFKRFFENLGRDGNNPLVDYMKNLRLQQAHGRKIEREADNFHEGWAKAKKEPGGTVELSAIMNDSTAHQVNPAYDWNSKQNAVARNSKMAKQKQMAHKDLRARYLKLSKLQQRLFWREAQYLAEMMETTRTGIIENLIEMYGMQDIAGIRNKLVNASVDDLNNMLPPVVRVVHKDGTVKYNPVTSWSKIKDNLVALKRLTEVNGPYFPLMRFGDFGLRYTQTTEKTGYATKEKASDAARRLRADEAGSKTTSPKKQADGSWAFSHEEVGFELFETIREGQAEQARLRAEGYSVGTVTTMAEMKFDESTSVGSILAVAEKKLGKDEQSRVALRNALITMMPPTSIQKRMIKRKNVTGASTDGHRVFANYIISASRNLARLKYGRAIEENYADIVDAPNQAGRMGVDGVVVGDVTNEIIRRHGATPTAGLFSEYAAKFGFLNYLFSLSYSAVNSTQTLLLSIPYLGGQYGGKKATAAVMKAYGDVGGDIAKRMTKAHFGLKLLGKDPTKADLNQLVDDIVDNLGKKSGQGRMLKHLADIGSIEATFTMELSEAAKHSSADKGLINTLIEVGRFMPYAVEVMNRSVTALAAYNLATEGGMDHYDAVEAARLAIVKTQFDYTALNRPRHFISNDVFRAMSMFKIHALGVYSFMIHNTRQALHGKNASAAEVKNARRALRLFLLTHAAFAGLAGSVLMEPVKLALGLLAEVWPDDDDDEGFLDNPDLWIRNMAYDMTGSKKFAATVVGGLPMLADVDMVTRVGLGNLMLMVQQGETPMETAIGTIDKSLLGPVFGYRDSVNTAFAAWNKGASFSKGLEYMVPKGIRDVMRGMRYKSEGMTDFNGNVIVNPEDFSPHEYYIRMFGFGTRTESEAYEARKVIQGAEGKARTSRDRILRRFANAKTNDDRKKIQKEAMEFSRSLPKDLRIQYRIRMSDLIKRRTSKLQRERKTEKGVYFDKGNRFTRERLESY